MKMRAYCTYLAAIVLTGCGGASAPDGAPTPTWDEFRGAAAVEPESGFFVVNGDEVKETEADLRAFYEEVVAPLEDGARLGKSRDALVVNRVGGRDDAWSAQAASNLTYCVSRRSFGARYDAVVQAMEAATGAWEAVASVRFVHRTDQDGSCTASNTNVVFDVRQTTSRSYLARAFFPSSGRSSRNVIISTTSFGNTGPYTLTGILRHELGHVLGFRHEHTRPEAGTCFEDNNWRGLTAFDAASVMMYPQCNGTNRGDLVLTARDAAGASALYP